MASREPYHEGEIAVQTRAGARDLAARHGRLIEDHIMAGALPFVASQRMVVLGSVGGGAGVWASVLFGEAGFVSVDARAVSLDLARSSRRGDDPLWADLEADARVGMLFIELRTRRRVRVNGTATLVEPARLRVAVTESYPNCSRFIRRREPAPLDPSELRRHGAMRSGAALDAIVQSRLASADTLFVATAHPTRGVDVSHRGGPAGFVKVMPDGALRVPDYAGNGMFNTLGNLAVDPRAGLLFVDFQRGDLVQLTGRAEILWDVDDPAGDTGGTRRWWEFRAQRGIVSEGAAPPGWLDLE